MTFLQDMIEAGFCTTSMAVADAVDEATYDPFYWLGSCLAASSSTPSQSAIASSVATTTTMTTDRRLVTYHHHHEHSDDDAELAVAVSRVLGKTRGGDDASSLRRQTGFRQSLDDIGLAACCYPMLAPSLLPECNAGSAGPGGESKEATRLWMSPSLSERLEHSLPGPNAAASESRSGGDGDGGGRGYNGTGAGSDAGGDDDMSARTDVHSVYSFLVVSSPLMQQGQQQQQLHHQPPFPGHRPQSSLECLARHLRTSPHHHHQSHHRRDDDCCGGGGVSPEEPCDVVLTPSLMQQLQRAFPLTKRGDSFFLQYSLVRDGASLDTLLDRAQPPDGSNNGTARHSVLAVETVDGEVFGAFLSQPWRRAADWYGGGESFVWTTTVLPPSSRTTGGAGRHDNNNNVSGGRFGGGGDHSWSTTGAVRCITRRRTVPLDDLPEVESENDEIDSCDGDGDGNDDDRRTSSENKDADDDDDDDGIFYGHERRRLEVYKYSFGNPYIQLCLWDRLVIGGGDGDEADCHQGFGLTLDQDLLTGSSHPCRTFHSPSLSRHHSDGSPFEVRNVEVWNLTPCLSMVEAEGRKVVHRSRARTKNRR